jgi:CRP-like cAMP-binding protein
MALSKADFGLLERGLEPVALKRRMRLELPDKPFNHVYFPEAGMVSVVAKNAHAGQIEAGIIGWEGMSGIPLILGDDRSPNSTFVQMDGHGRRIEADHMRRAIQASPTLQREFLRFSLAFLIQNAHTALANGRAKVEKRLARWILMAHDRADGNALALTHEFLAIMLGVRRAGVTVALQQLEKRGLLETKRSLIVVEDRAGLEDFAGGFYGSTEIEYARLTGWRTSQRS